MDDRCQTCGRKRRFARALGYREQLRLLQAQLGAIQRVNRAAVVVVLDGRDAAGKTGTIRRMVREMDPALYRVHHSTAERPAPVDLQPAPGRLVIYDRSWWSRAVAVLADSGQQLDAEAQEERELDHAAAIDQKMRASGAVLLKFWCELSRPEQERRLKQRAKDQRRRWRLSDRDWRALERHDEYTAAFAEVRDDSWTLVSFEDKRAGRLEVLDVVLGAMLEANAPAEEPGRSVVQG